MLLKNKNLLLTFLLTLSIASASAETPRTNEQLIKCANDQLTKCEKKLTQKYQSGHPSLYNIIATPLGELLQYEYINVNKIIETGQQDVIHILQHTFFTLPKKELELLVNHFRDQLLLQETTIPFQFFFMSLCRILNSHSTSNDENMQQLKDHLLPAINTKVEMYLTSEFRTLKVPEEELPEMITDFKQFLTESNNNETKERCVNALARIGL